LADEDERRLTQKKPLKIRVFHARILPQGIICVSFTYKPPSLRQAQRKPGRGVQQMITADFTGLVGSPERIRRPNRLWRRPVEFAGMQKPVFC
jgi:hypothetical protein